MKLADKRAAAYETVFTKDGINALREKKDAKSVYTVLNFGFDYTYNNASTQIFDAIIDNCSGFVVDIAKRFSKSDFQMSEKQTWLIAYAFIGIKNTIELKESMYEIEDNDDALYLDY